MADDRSTGRTDSASRVIRASADDIYAAFGDGETLMKWLPPANMTGTASEYAFQPGGHYRIELRYRDGSAGKTTTGSDVTTGTFAELVPGRRIRQTVQFESPDESLARGMTMTWIFEPAAEGTRVTVTAEGVPSAIGKRDHMQGLTSSLDNLARYVER